MYCHKLLFDIDSANSANSKYYETQVLYAYSKNYYAEQLIDTITKIILIYARLLKYKLMRLCVNFTN